MKTRDKWAIALFTFAGLLSEVRAFLGGGKPSITWLLVGVFLLSLAVILSAQLHRR